MLTPKKVKVVEVGPRDGLQNEKKILELVQKIEYIKLLSNAGISDIETTSFVRAAKIPQMQDGPQLFLEILKLKELETKRLIALVPNLKGLDDAISAGVKNIAVFTSTSETFNQKNINATIAESMAKIKDVMIRARDEKLNVRAYVSTVFGCPYEGKTSYETFSKLARELLNLGAYEISVGDTIGVAHPIQVEEFLTKALKEFPREKLAMHFHDTKGLAAANILTSLKMGIEIFDSSSGGLGGCPYAEGASGNVSTEDIVHLFHSMGIETGIDLKKLQLASEYVLTILDRPSQSKMYQYLNAHKFD
jgi:hydroxymethylglutaryl-CoA lyase